MYIFRRTSCARPDRAFEALEFSVAIAARAAESIGRPISVFNTLFGAPNGTIHWTTRVDSLADLGALTATLAADGGYLEMLAGGRDLFATLPSDSVATIVSAANVTEHVARYYQSTVAVPRAGSVADAITVGVELQSLAATTGLTTMFGTSGYGAYGEVGWLVGADDLAGIDRFREFATTNADFVSKVVAAGPLFVEGSGVNTLIERIN